MNLLFRSLTFRVIAFSTVWAVLALIVIATVISTLYRQASERGFDSLLSAHLFNLIGSVSVTEAGQLTGNPDLGDLRFSEPESGWYWSVEPVSGGLTGELHSISMTKPLASPPSTEVPFNKDFQRNYTAQGIRRRGDRSVRERVRPRQQEPRRALPRDGQPHRAGERGRRLPAAARDLSRRVRHRHDRHQCRRHPARPAAAQAGSAVRWRWCARAMPRRLDGRFPAEIEPLANETNALIENNKRIVERSRTQVGNLAHSLKTPLAVMLNEGRVAGRRQGQADRRPGIGHADAGRALSAARPRRRAARQRRLPHAGRGNLEAHGAGDREAQSPDSGDAGAAGRGDRVCRRARGSRGDRRQPARQRHEMGQEQGGGVGAAGARRRPGQPACSR